LLGDPLYVRKGQKPLAADWKPALTALSGQALVAFELGFVHPRTGRSVHFGQLSRVFVESWRCRRVSPQNNPCWSVFHLGSRLASRWARPQFPSTHAPLSKFTAQRVGSWIILSLIDRRRATG
jgi:hypothetical protein